MTDLGPVAVDPPDEFAIADDAAADTRPEGEEDHVVDVVDEVA